MIWGERVKQCDEEKSKGVVTTSFIVDSTLWNDVIFHHKNLPALLLVLL